MKTIVLSMLTVLSVNAFALDLAEKHEALCSSEAVASEKGEAGTCRIVVAVAPTGKSEGYCTGNFRGALPCIAVYVSTEEEGAAMQITCGTDPKNPMLEKIVEAQAISYSVAAVVTKADGSEVIISDSASYSYFESALLDLTLAKTETSTTGTFSINLKTGPSALTDVVCE